MTRHKTGDVVRRGTVRCIICPRGCMIDVTEFRSGPDQTRFKTRGNRCAKGKTYAAGELSLPTRILTTTVRTVFTDFPRLPVKTDRPVPKEELFRYMKIADAVVLDRRLEIGAVVCPASTKNGAALIATDDMTADPIPEKPLTADPLPENPGNG